MGACNSSSAQSPSGSGAGEGRVSFHEDVKPLAIDKPQRSSSSIDENRDLGKAFWEYREAKLAALATSVFCVFVFTAFAHNVLLGSFWCPFSQCPQNFESISTDDHHLTQQLAISGLCLFFDVFVITYHITHAVHPKYVVTKLRKRVITAHIISGALQTVLGPTIWFMHRFFAEDLRTTVTVLSRFLVVWGFAVHTPTAIFMMRTPFGAVRILMPAFIFVIAMYCYVLGEVWTAPYKLLERAIIEWWIMTHIYVLNRVTFSILTNLNVLAQSRYSVSILLGAAVCMPASMGSTCPAFLFVAIVIFNVVFLLTMDPSSHAPDGEIYSAGGEGITAKVKKHFVKPEGLVRIKTLKQLRQSKDFTEEDLSAYVFKKLHADDSETMSLVEIGRLLVAWGLPSYVSEEVLRERDVNGDGRIGKREFYENFRDVWQFAAAIVLTEAENGTIRRRSLVGGDDVPAPRLTNLGLA
mmetsp:Transcript_20426/g.52771  ORF Transcript_20426/g.52771 Transcript_20426/m.52771 type:complete len:467 (+) Transcript_20426:75-1475(+)